MSEPLEEWEVDNLLAHIMNLLYAYCPVQHGHAELAAKLRQLAGHIEAGGPRPTNILPNSPSGYKIP